MSTNVSGFYVLSKPKFDLKKSFQSAIVSKSVDKMLKVFKQMEPCFDESDLCLESYLLALSFLNQGILLDQVLFFGNKALNIFISNQRKNMHCFGNTYSPKTFTFRNDGTSCTHNHNSSFYIARVCILLASASLKLERYNECLCYLNWANRNFTTLFDNNISLCSVNCVMSNLITTQLKLFEVMLEMGRLEEAMSFGFKSLELLRKDKGNSRSDTVNVAVVVRELADIYRELGEYEKALELNQLSQSIFKNKRPNSPNFFGGENDYGNILIGLGRYEEAIVVLNRVAHADTEGSVRGISFVNLAKAFFHLGKCDEAKRVMKTAQRLLGKKDTRPICVAIGFGDMSVLYEKMNDIEKAISLLRRALSIPRIPHNLLVEGSMRLFSLISLSGKEEQGIEYMEDVVEKLKEKFGPEHWEVARGYRNLGAAYLKSGRGDLAVNLMAKAKDIMDAKLGPHHLDSLKTSQTLAETYAAMRSYDPAVACQQKVVEGLEGLGPNEQDKLDKAVRFLNQLKEMAS